ncbi:MAG: SigB/SigF/SigG family RNA polymerase sigma factor [Clostridia bacterium]|nr:SigB/SigF/SigG family RNA polymerase sigma factor [Clostridia bacterium]
MDNKKIEENIGLVHSVAKRFLGRGTDYEDLVQIGSIGLIKAVNNFDESLGFKFSTYAVPMIMGEIKRYLRDDGLVKVSRTIKENAGKIGFAKEKLNKKLGRSPSLSELSKETGLSLEDIADAIDATRPAESLYDKHDDDDNFVIDKIKVNEEEEEQTVNRIFIKELLDTLDNRSKKVILLRYFKEETQQQIADKLGVSQVQISRIEKKSLETLRKRFKECI